tara:strand:+ start:12598 stop:13044 length:447 start_codon:yes stop_codon:yes gene_type:complete
MKTNTINKTEIKISLQEHTELMKTGVGSWGNGYLEVPKEHIAFDYLMSCAEKSSPHGFYENICGEEITYSHIDYDSDGIEESVTIGFDTLHGYNNETHDKKYVVNKCNEMKDYFNSNAFKLKLIEEIKEDISWHEKKIIELKNKILQI